MTHQGFIGSFLASALLVSSAVAVLMIAGAIVAFEGWPGAGVHQEVLPLSVAATNGSSRPEPDIVVRSADAVRHLGGGPAGGQAAAEGPGGADGGGPAASAVSAPAVHATEAAPSTEDGGTAGSGATGDDGSGGGASDGDGGETGGGVQLDELQLPDGLDALVPRAEEGLSDGLDALR